MRASSSASSAGIEICWSTKWDIPAWRAPGTSVSPSTSSVAACAAISVRSGTPCARAARGVSRTSAPPTVKASAPIAAPFMKARRSMSCMVSSPAPRQGALVIGNHRGAVRRANTVETAAVFWNGSKIQRRFRERIKRPRAASARGFDLAAEQPLGVAIGDALGLVLGKLRQPAAVGLHDGVIAEPALVDPGIGAEQEAIGMTSEELAPLGRQLAAAFADAATVGELAHQLGVCLQQLSHPPCRRRKSGMRPDDLGAAIVREQNQQRRLVAMGEKIEITSGGEVDDPLDQRCLRGITVNVELADAAEIAAFVFGLDQVVDRGIGRPILDVVARAIGADERHHPKPGSLGVDELMGAFVRRAVRQDAGDAVAPKNVEHALERIIWVGLLIIMKMRVEDFQRLLRAASNRCGEDNDRSGDGARDNSCYRHGEPPIRRPDGRRCDLTAFSNAARRARRGNNRPPARSTALLRQIEPDMQLA